MCAVLWWMSSCGQIGSYHGIGVWKAGVVWCCWCCVKKKLACFWRLGVVLANGVRVVPLVGQWHSESGSVCRLLFGWLGGFAFAKWGLMVSVEWYE